MPEMTLLEALQTDEVKTVIAGQVQEAVAEALSGDSLTETVTAAVTSAMEAQLPTLRESALTSVREGTQVTALHTEAVRLIEASPLRGAAKANLLEDYGLVESADDDTAKPGRALALIEAEVDAEDKVVKTAKQVLRESVEADIKRQRNILRESAPSMPRAPGGGGGDGADPPAAEVPFLGEDSPAAQMLRDKGMDPAQFGATPTPAGG